MRTEKAKRVRVMDCRPEGYGFCLSVPIDDNSRLVPMDEEDLAYLLKDASMALVSLQDDRKKKSSENALQRTMISMSSDMEKLVKRVNRIENIMEHNPGTTPAEIIDGTLTIDPEPMNKEEDA